MSKQTKLEPTEGERPKRRDHWSEDGQVFFCDGYGWGITDSLQIISLGKEDDIPKFFDSGELDNNLKPIQRQVLVEIKEYRREQGIGESNTRTGNLQRGSNNGASRRKQKATRHLKTRKAISLRLSRKKSKSLPR